MTPNPHALTLAAAAMAAALAQAGAAHAFLAQPICEPINASQANTVRVTDIGAITTLTFVFTNGGATQTFGPGGSPPMSTQRKFPLPAGLWNAAVMPLTGGAPVSFGQVEVKPYTVHGNVCVFAVRPHDINRPAMVRGAMGQ